MTYNAFSGTLNPTQSTDFPRSAAGIWRLPYRLRKTTSGLQKCCDQRAEDSWHQTPWGAQDRDDWFCCQHVHDASQSKTPSHWLPVSQLNITGDWRGGWCMCRLSRLRPRHFITATGCTCVCHVDNVVSINHHRHIDTVSLSQHSKVKLTALCPLTTGDTSTPSACQNIARSRWQRHVH